MPRIFVSYRRADSLGSAGRIYDWLVREFGADDVFMDVDTIQPGAEFRRVLSAALGKCDVLIAIIGRRWLESEAGGPRRLDDADDFVRQEIEGALARSIQVIPALVEGAMMPTAVELPASMQKLPGFQYVEVRHHRFEDDVRHLIDGVKQILERTSAHPEPPDAVKAWLRETLGEPRGIGEIILRRLRR